jgi:hypothetical protein
LYGNITKKTDANYVILEEILAVLDIPQKNDLSVEIAKYISSLGLEIDFIKLGISLDDICECLSSGNIERLKNNPRYFDKKVFFKETKFLG